MYFYPLPHCYTSSLFQEKFFLNIIEGNVIDDAKAARQFQSEFYQNKVMQYEALTSWINIKGLLNPWSLRYAHNGFSKSLIKIHTCIFLF